MKGQEPWQMISFLGTFGLPVNSESLEAASSLPLYDPAALIKSNLRFIQNLSTEV